MPVDNSPTHQIIMRNSEYSIIGLHTPFQKTGKTPVEQVLIASVRIGLRTTSRVLLTKTDVDPLSINRILLGYDSQRTVFHVFGLVARIALIATLKRRAGRAFLERVVVFGSI